MFSTVSGSNNYPVIKTEKKTAVEHIGSITNTIFCNLPGKKSKENQAYEQSNDFSFLHK